jgi:hypothetical protein
MTYATRLALLLTTWKAFDVEFATRICEIVDRRRKRLEAIAVGRCDPGRYHAATGNLAMQVASLEQALVPTLAHLPVQRPTW